VYFITNSTIDQNQSNNLKITINCLFDFGGLVGACCAKFVLDYFGRKMGIILQYLVSLIGLLLLIAQLPGSSIESTLIGLIFFGIQSGMACVIVPVYLYEISPISIRAQAVIIHQFFIHIALFLMSFLNFELLNFWKNLIAVSMSLAVFACMSFVLLIPDSPRALLIERNNEDKAREALIKLRGRKDVSGEIAEMIHELSQSNEVKRVSIYNMLKWKEIHWIPLSIGMILQLSTSLASFFIKIITSPSLGKLGWLEWIISLRISLVVAPVIVFFMIQKLGRKTILINSMAALIFTYIVLLIFNEFVVIF
jgi:MFS family permease